MEGEAVVVAFVGERNEVGAGDRHLVEVKLGLQTRKGCQKLSQKRFSMFTNK